MIPSYSYPMLNPRDPDCENPQTIQDIAEYGQGEGADLLKVRAV
jgi:hypothetical protein